MSTCENHKTPEGLQESKLRCWKKTQMARGRCGRRDLVYARWLLSSDNADVGWGILNPRRKAIDSIHRLDCVRVFVHLSAQFWLISRWTKHVSRAKPKLRTPKPHISTRSTSQIRILEPVFPLTLSEVMPLSWIVCLVWSPCLFRLSPIWIH